MTSKRLDAVLAEITWTAAPEARDFFEVQVGFGSTFWQSVDWLVENIPYPPRPRLARGERTYSLRSEMDSLRGSLVTRTELAAALVELGYRVEFTSEELFRTDYPCEWTRRR